MYGHFFPTLPENLLTEIIGGNRINVKQNLPRACSVSEVRGARGKKKYALRVLLLSPVP